MSWASRAIEELKNGNETQVKPRGHSMKPRVKDGQVVTLCPCKPEDLVMDSVVLVKVRGNVYLHEIKAIDGNRFLIGNHRGHVNGWVGANCIYGKMK